MKSNVDLTANRRFSSNSSREQLLSVRQLFGLKKRKPWELSDSQRIVKLLNDPMKQLVLVGNKEDRKKTRYYKNMENSCHRCGTSFRKPWDNHHGLCTKCNKLINKEYRKDKGLYLIRKSYKQYKNFTPDTEGNLTLNN